MQLWGWSRRPPSRPQEVRFSSASTQTNGAIKYSNYADISAFASYMASLRPFTLLLRGIAPPQLYLYTILILYAWIHYCYTHTWHAIFFLLNGSTIQGICESFWRSRKGERDLEESKRSLGYGLLDPVLTHAHISFTHLDLGGIESNVIMTTHMGHAREYVLVPPHSLFV